MVGGLVLMRVHISRVAVVAPDRFQRASARGPSPRITDGDGKYDVLEVETRNFKGPRNYEPSGLPLHDDTTVASVEVVGGESDVAT